MKPSELLNELNDVCLRRHRAVDMSERIIYILDELVAQQSAKYIVGNEQLFENLLRNLEPGNGSRAVKVCHIWNVAIQEGIIPTRELLEIYINWLSTILEQENMFVSDCFRSLALTLSLRNSKTLMATQKIMHPTGTVFRILSTLPEGKITEDFLMRLEVLKSYCRSSKEETMDISQHIVAQCFNTFVSVLQNADLSEKDPLAVRAFSISLQGLNNIYTCTPSHYAAQSATTLNLAKAYSFFGLPGHTLQLKALTISTISVLPYVVPGSDKAVPPKATPRKKKGHKPRKQRNDAEKTTEDDCQDVVDIVTTPFMKPAWKINSDSDYSDTEQRSLPRELQCKVRSKALQLLSTLFKHLERRVVMSYLPAFLPDSEYPSNNEHENLIFNGQHLLVPILKDPSPQVRSTALQALAALLDAARPSLAMVQKSHSTSFVSLSQTLSHMCVTVQRTLLLALKAEHFPHVLIPLFQCLTIAAGTFQYSSLPSGMLRKLIVEVKHWLQHKDIKVVVACLALLRTVTATHPHSTEVVESLTSDFVASSTNLSPSFATELGVDDDEEVDPTDLVVDVISPADDSNEPHSNAKSCWLLNVCIRGAKRNTRVEDNSKLSSVCVPLRLESMLVMGDLSKNNFPMVQPYMNEILGVLCASLTENETDIHVRLRAARVLAMVLTSIGEQTQKGCFVTEGYDIWMRVLRNPVLAIHQDKSELLRTEACNCLAAMSPTIFDLLQRDIRLLCVTLILGSASDTEPTVKAAAVRGVGFYVTFPALLEDTAFLQDAAEAIIGLMGDESVAVQSNAAWSLGNLSDTVRNLSETHGLPEDVPTVFLTKLLRAATGAANGSTKVKASGVRALGLLLKVFPWDNIGAESDIVAAVTALNKNATCSRIVKNQWNACYAVGNLLKNERLLSSSPGWLPTLLGSLVDIVERCNNFKVRIAATIALSVPNSRVSYGDLYGRCWKMGFNTLHAVEQSEEFGEYQHKEQLISQVCLLFCHLTKLLTPTDVTLLQDILLVHCDAFAHYMKKFKSNILPEQATPLLEANEVMQKLAKQQNITSLDSLFAVFDLSEK